MTAPRPHRSTIADVADAAGVSVATVSRALRGLPNVATSTRRRVADVAAALSYTADPAASRLAAGRTMTISVVVPSLSSWYFATVVAGVEAVAAEEGYDVLVVGVGADGDLARILDDSYHLERRMDGIVVIDIGVSEQAAASIAARGVALVTVGREIDGVPSRRVDNNAVGALAVSHLVELGHRRVGVIADQRDGAADTDASRMRLAGFAEALRVRSLAFDADLVEGGGYDLDGGRDAMRALLDRPEPPTAVFALSDEMAFGALTALAERGLRAGTDVSLVGVDDHEFSRVVGLTTIRQPVADHGAAAARLLLQSIAALRRTVAVEPTHQVAPVDLVVRTTTGPPPGAAATD